MKLELVTYVLLCLASTGDCLDTPIKPIREPLGDPPESEVVYSSETPADLDALNLKCQEYHKSPDYIWEPVQEVCISCRLCQDSKDVHCQSCKKATTTQVGEVTKPLSSLDLIASPNETQKNVPSTALPGHDVPKLTENTKLGAVAIAAIVLGCVSSVSILVAVTLMGIRFFWKRNRQANDKAPTDGTPRTDGERNEGEERCPLRAHIPQQDHEPVPSHHPQDPNIITVTPADAGVAMDEMV
ncbi:uncharacterized protein LOC110973109 isoform X4 [Acanthaster planci]|nr:uncharacterized protein LOC110973109 isoform X2 [Acanthaster planci]XP_022079323.1 uncharacterized protein LOC110973109 isoform X3 [Acanthaster planci]XP_022079324.1 uncharacterized protein LOC110973109 isoform X4 [Acanthaster planci]